MPETNDIVLLRQYVDEGSEEAFAALVTRHIAKVYSVALRFTHNTAQAEEITQAVFILFARKAGGLGDKVVISGWLYQTARLTARTFIRSEIRRSYREQEAFMQNVLEKSETDVWPQISPLLDAALAALNEAERNAVVLRYFDSKSLREVGDELGVNEDAAKKRVQRAVEKLRRFFEKRNLAVSVTAMESAITANAAHGAPAGLAKSVLMVALTKGTVAGSSTLTLMEATLKGMAWAKLKTAAVVGAVVLAAAVTVPATIEQFQQTPTGKLTFSALIFIKDLKLEGKLPGIESNTPTGTIIPFFSVDPTNHTEHFGSTNITYPFIFELTVLAHDPNDLYHYKIRKDSETAHWKMLKAWLSDTNMSVIKEYPVPPGINQP